MQAAAQGRSSTSAPGDGSRTLTIVNDPSLEGQEIAPEGGQGVGTLKLRSKTKKNTQRVVWGEGVVDNEGFGKKKSKSILDYCCALDDFL